MFAFLDFWLTEADSPLLAMKPDSSVTYIDATLRVDDPASLQNDQQYRDELKTHTDKIREEIEGALEKLGCFSKRRLHVKMCLEEVFPNAVYHGNLGRGSKAREDGRMEEDLEESQNRDFYDRTVHVVVRFGIRDVLEKPQSECIGTLPNADSVTSLIINVTDEGEGFNPDDVPDPTLAENLDRPCGRGLMLMRNFARKVEYNSTGNSVTLTINTDPVRLESTVASDDTTTDKARDWLQSVVTDVETNKRSHVVVCNLSSVEYITSEFLNSLVILSKHELVEKIELHHPSDLVREVLTLSRMEGEIFTIV